VTSVVTVRVTMRVVVTVTVVVLPLPHPAAKTTKASNGKSLRTADSMLVARVGAWTGTASKRSGSSVGSRGSTPSTESI
jgi:hypothetical protein